MTTDLFEILEHQFHIYRQINHLNYKIIALPLFKNELIGSMEMVNWVRKLVATQLYDILHNVNVLFVRFIFTLVFYVLGGKNGFYFCWRSIISWRRDAIFANIAIFIHLEPFIISINILMDYWHSILYSFASPSVAKLSKCNLFHSMEENWKWEMRIEMVFVIWILLLWYISLFGCYSKGVRFFLLVVNISIIIYYQ